VAGFRNHRHRVRLQPAGDLFGGSRVEQQPNPSPIRVVWWKASTARGQCNRDLVAYEFDDLRGACWPSMSRAHGRDTGDSAPDRPWTQEVVEAGFTMALQMVAERRGRRSCQTATLSVVPATPPATAAWRRDLLGPSPSQPVVVRSGLDPTFKEQCATTKAPMGLHDL